MYLVANLNGDTSFLLAPPLTSSENLHSSQPISESDFSVDVFEGSVKDLPESLALQVVVLGEEGVAGAQVSVEQAGQEHHDEQRMVIDIRSNGCYTL